MNYLHSFHLKSTNRNTHKWLCSSFEFGCFGVIELNFSFWHDLQSLEMVAYQTNQNNLLCYLLHKLQPNGFHSYMLVLDCK